MEENRNANAGQIQTESGQNGTAGRNEPKRVRDLNADLIRCVAVYSVTSVHFLLNSGFYGVPVSGADMWIMCMVRSLFMCCVPLFMILTGYLMQHKTLSGRYYRGLVKTLEIYVLASIACLLFKKFVQGQEVTLLSGILDILDFDAANYAWYIEMYIGLFLIIPFLNLIWRGLGTKREKRVLVVTMLALTLLPKLLNNFDFRTEGWWASPSISEKYDPLVPGFFTTMYPITYYFIGAYWKEYGWRMGKARTLLLLLLAVVLFGSYNYWRSDGGNFVWASNSTWGGENLITATLLFGLLLQMKPKRWPRMVQSWLVYLSGISLGLYLVSWIFDRIVYDGIFKPAVTDVHARWPWYFVVVPAVFFGAAGCSALLYEIRDLAYRIAHLICRKKQAA